MFHVFPSQNESSPRALNFPMPVVLCYGGNAASHNAFLGLY